MYDRKTWIILAICGVLIAANIHFSAKKAAYERANAPVTKETVEPVSAADPVSPEAGLTVETPPPPTSEETVVLENDKVAFTLSNIGGGIKYAELKEQKNVAETSNVRINKNGPAPLQVSLAPEKFSKTLPMLIKQNSRRQGKPPSSSPSFPQVSSPRKLSPWKHPKSREPSIS